MSNNVLIILGSGASTEFLGKFRDKLLSTEVLTHIISDNFSEFIDYLNKEDCENKDKIYFINEFLVDLNFAVRKYCGSNFNFEDIIHLIDIIVDIYSSKNSMITSKRLNDTTNKNIYLSLIDYFNAKPSGKYSWYLRELPQNIRYFLLDFICDHYSPLSVTSYSDKTDRDLWASFLTKHNNVNIFSLNYDSLIFEIVDYINKNKGASIETGFNINSLPLSNGTSNFLKQKFIAANNIFAPLHGSVHFVPETGGVLFCRDSFYAKKERKRIATSRNQNQDNTTDYNQIMITGLNKIDSIMKEPFGTYYLRLTKNFIESNTIYIIGYGGNDLHINMLLKSGYCIDKEIHVTIKLPDSYLDNDYRLDLLDHDEFYYIRKFIPDDCFVHTNLDKKIDNKIFFGKNCYIYPKGTKNFLTQINAS